MTWMSVTAERPPMNEPLLVIVQEWGQSPLLVIARAFQSKIPNQPIKWILDRNVYQYDRPFYIAAQVRYWMRIEEFPKDIRERELRLINCMELEQEWRYDG